MTNAQLRLRRVRLADDVYGARSPRRFVRGRTRCRCVTLPIAEHFGRELFDFSRLDVTDDDHRHAIRRIPLCVERADGVAGEATDARLITAIGVRITRRRLVQESREHLVRQPTRLGPKL